MSHEIFGNMFIERADRERAWHKLGQTFESDQNMLPSEAIGVIGGNVPIEVHPQIVVLSDGTQIKTADNVIVRPAWNGHEAEVFGSVSANWEVVKYEDVASMFDRAAKYYRLETMGVLKAGALYFLTLAGEGFDVTANGKNDAHDSYIYAAIYNLPGKANIIGAGSTRIVCYNTFCAALHGARMVLPVTHHQGANVVMRFIADSIARIGSAQNALRQAYQYMADQPLTTEDATEFFAKTWPIPERPKLAAYIDSMTATNSSEMVETEDLVAQVGVMLGAISGTTVAQPERVPVQIDTTLQDRRDRSEAIWQATCERAKRFRQMAEVSLGNMADDQGLGINKYTALQAVIETSEHGKGGRGNVASDLIFGTRGQNIQRAVNLLTTN